MTATRNRLPAGRGICADCGADSALTAAGEVIVHGPRDLRCTGSGRPPRPPSPPLFVPAVGTPADTITEPSEAVEPASAPVRYQEGDRVRSGPGGIMGTVEAVYPWTVEVTWDDGRVQTLGLDGIELVERPAPETETVAEVAALPLPPVYVVLDEDDGEIDGGAVTPRAETSHWDMPVEFPEPFLLGMAQRSRIEQLEAEAARLLPDGEAQRRRIAVLEGQLDASREDVAALTRRLSGATADRDAQIREATAAREDARRSRDALRTAMDLIGKLGPA